MDYKRKIDVEESKRQGKIVTKEIDKNDPDYNKYPENVEYIDDFHIKGSEMDKYIDDRLSNNPEPSTGIEIYYLYLFLVFFAIPVSFVILKAFIAGGNSEFFYKIFYYVIYVVIYSLLVFITPIIALKRKDISLYHKKITRIMMGNNLVLLIWLTVFVITPMIMDIDIPMGKAKLTFVLYFFLAIFDMAAQLFIVNMKEKHPEKIELLERTSLALSIVTIWGYGAIICPLIFSKTSERIIFDIAILAFVGIMSVINYIAYKRSKNKVLEDYTYNGNDYYKGGKMKITLILEGILIASVCLLLICADII